MINIFNNKNSISYYDSIEEFTNFIDNSTSMRYNSSDNRDFDFSGTHSLKEASKLCKYGDKELASYILQQSLKFDNVDTLNKIKRSTINDVVGFMPNVPNYVIGIPTNMIRDNRNIINSKVINIFISISAAWHISKEDIKERCAKYVAAINILEEQGYRCNVYTGAVGTNRDRIYNLLVIKIKSDREPLNLTKMAFPLAHPSMLRRLKFRWMETIPLDFGPGYGQSVTNEKKIIELLKPIFNDTKFTILSVSEEPGKIGSIVNILKKKGMVNDDKQTDS